MSASQRDRSPTARVAPMLAGLSRTKRNWGLALFGLLVLWFCWGIREVLNPLVLGYFLAFIVHPAVLRLERHGWKRRRAVNLIFVTGGLLGVSVTLALLVQGANLAERLTKMPILEPLAETGGELLEAVREWLPAQGEGETAGPAAVADAEPEAAPGPIFQDASVKEVLQGLWGQLSAEQAAGASSIALRGAGGLWSSLRHWFGSLLGLGLLLVLLPVYTYFLLFELGRIHGFVARYIPVRQRAHVASIGRQIGEVIASFFRGRLIVCFLKGGLLTVGLTLVGTDYALLLGMGSGMLALVPFVGPLTGFVLAFVVGLTQPDVQLVGLALRTGIVFGVAEVAEGYYLIPKILGDSLGLHPVVVLVSVFAGGAVLGMFGFLIALPLTATIVILVRELVLPSLAEFADEDGKGSATG